MAGVLQRIAGLLPALWLGWLLCVALLATPVPFALLERPEAGRLVARMLAIEAHSALLFGGLVLVLERMRQRQVAWVQAPAHAGAGDALSATLLLAAGAVFCTVAGYFALQGFFAAARQGQGALSFGQLHAISVAFFAVKLGLVAALAWRAVARPGPLSRAPTS